MERIYGTIREKLANFIERSLEIIASFKEDTFKMDIPSRAAIEKMLGSIYDFQIIAFASIIARHKINIKRPSIEEFRKTVEENDVFDVCELLPFFSIMGEKIAPMKQTLTDCRTKSSVMEFKYKVTHDQKVFEGFCGVVEGVVNLYNTYQDFFRELMSVKIEDVITIQC